MTLTSAPKVVGMPWRDEVCLRGMKEVELALGVEVILAPLACFISGSPISIQSNHTGRRQNDFNVCA